MIKFTMKEWRDICRSGFLNAIETLQNEGINELHSDEEMKAMARAAIDRDDMGLAAFLCKEIWEEGASSDAYYKYDVSMGTLESVLGLNNEEDVYRAFIDYCRDYSFYDEPAWEEVTEE